MLIIRNSVPLLLGGVTVAIGSTPRNGGVDPTARGHSATHVAFITRSLRDEGNWISDLAEAVLRPATTETSVKRPDIMTSSRHGMHASERARPFSSHLVLERLSLPGGIPLQSFGLFWIDISTTRPSRRSFCTYTTTVFRGSGLLHLRLRRHVWFLHLSFFISFLSSVSHFFFSMAAIAGIGHGVICQSFHAQMSFLQLYIERQG